MGSHRVTGPETASHETSVSPSKKERSNQSVLFESELLILRWLAMRFVLVWTLTALSISNLAVAQPAQVDRGATPAVSPDGLHIAFLSNRSGQSQVFVIQPDGTHEVQLTVSPEEKNPPHWMDRTTVIFSQTKDENSRLFAVDLDGKNLREIGSVPGRNPIPSPDGKQVVYMVGPWTATRFVFSGLHNEAPRQLTDGSSTTWTPIWSPDGKRIAFTRRDENWLNVWVMNADGSSPKQVSHVAHEEGQAQFPGWSADGKRLAVQVNGGPKDKRTAHLWTLDLASDTARKLGVHTQAYLDETPSWFPDGKRIAFQSNRTGRMEIWVMNADGSNQRQVTK
jgi:TolB protein